MMASDDELAQDLQFISYLLIFGASVNYAELTDSERTTADRLLRMGVLVEVEGQGKRIMLTKPWKKAFETKRRRSA